MEVQRDHVLGRRVKDEDDLLDSAQAVEAASGEETQLPFQALGSQATFDRVLYDGGEFGHAGEVLAGSDEEMDFLGIPGLLEPDQMRDLLHSRQNERARRQRRTSSSGDAEHVDEGLTGGQTAHQRLAGLRKELNGLVAAWHHRTGQPHGATHAALRRECGGPPAAAASADQLSARIDRIRSWATGRSS